MRSTSRGDSLPLRADSLPLRADSLPLRADSLPRSEDRLPRSEDRLPQRGERLPQRGERLPLGETVSPEGRPFAPKPANSAPCKATPRTSPPPANSRSYKYPLPIDGEGDDVNAPNRMGVRSGRNSWGNYEPATRDSTQAITGSAMSWPT